MTNADWWARVVQARTDRDDLRPHRVWALRKDGHEVAIDVKAVPGIGAEIVLTVNGQLRKTRLFRSHEQAETGGRDRGHAGDVGNDGMGVTGDRAAVPATRLDVETIAGAVIDMSGDKIDKFERWNARRWPRHGRTVPSTSPICSTRSREPTGPAPRGGICRRRYEPLPRRLRRHVVYSVSMTTMRRTTVRAFQRSITSLIGDRIPRLYTASPAREVVCAEVTGRAQTRRRHDG